ncbi:MAG: nucleoside triphosphate pyrophosphohydrolase [Synechococcaceae bacterium WB6_3B_236]|nr:nucleoside triphosphate pyrophosphohydrolase [Synechococcaceae bacterium WB6_3B_236]
MTDPIAELVALVARLRDPEAGCPWDLAQTHQSLIPYLLEEAHELADALRQGEDRAKEREAFDLASVAATISAKLVRRHPHVFGGELRSWEEIKRQEQAERGEELSLTDELRRKLRGQGALAGAMAISKKAAAAGFEWNAIDGVWAKVQEELDELKQALNAAETSGDRSHAQTELGDLLFTLVNVARWCQLDPEEGLAGTNQRFLDRFGRVEAALGGDLSGSSLEELEALWQQAKAEIRAAQGS